MTHPLHRLARAVVPGLTLLTIGTAGCSSDGNDRDAGTTAAANQPGVAPATEPTAPSPGATDPPTESPLGTASTTGESPTADSTTADSTQTSEPEPVATSQLDALFDRGFGAGTADEHARVEQSIAECMREQGFEYTPEPYAPALSASETAAISRDTYGGYGIVVALPDRLAAGESATPSAIPQPVPAAGQPVPSPNDAYVAGLSAPERVAYSVALIGYDPASAPITVAGSPEPPQACEQKARLAVRGNSPYEIPELSQRLDEILGTIDADPRVRQAIDAWTECVEAVFGDVGAQAIDDVSLSDYVSRQVDDAIGVQTAGNGESATQVGTPHPISDDEIQRLADLELRAYDTDRACLQQAGVEAARTQVENEVAAQLLDEYPELALD